MMDFYTNVDRKGKYLLVRGIKDGQEVRDRIAYQPTYYTLTNKNYGFKTIYGDLLKPHTFDTMYEAKEFCDERVGSNSPPYGYPNPRVQYALEAFKDSVDKYDRNYIRTWYLDIEVTSEEGFPNPMEAKFPITAIAIYDTVGDMYVVYGMGHWDKEHSHLPDDIKDRTFYIKSDNEQQMMDRFLNFLSDHCPNIITGWNIRGFDMPYIYNRLVNIGLDVNRLSPWGFTRAVEFKRLKDMPDDIIIGGVDIIDYMPLYKKNKVKESYKLDAVVSDELGENKSLDTLAMLDVSRTPFSENLSRYHWDETDDPEFNRFARIRAKRLETDLDHPMFSRLVEEEKKAAHQAFITYNIQDTNLVRRLDEKLGLLDTRIMIAYEACINFAESESPVRVWDSLINKELSSNNVISHYSLNVSSDSGGIPGGFVKEPKVGKHGWCLSFDLASLYPHLIMQYNISPETLDKEFLLWPTAPDEEKIRRFLNEDELNKEEGYSYTPSGYRFTNKLEGVVPRLMKKMYNDRKAFKKQMLKKQKAGEDSTIENLKQYVLKILLNSGYGALTNKYLRWFDLRLGSSITLSGQYIIQLAEKTINEWMNKVLETEGKDYIIAIDTDSNYVNFQPFVDKYLSDKDHDVIVDYLDKVAEKKVQEVLERAFLRSKDYTGAFMQKMVMEREAIASTAFWTAKKRYAMRYHDMEGIRKTATKIQGLEAIRSSTPIVCRKPLLELIDIILMQDEECVRRYIKDFKNQFMQMSPKDIAMPRTVNNLRKYTQSDGFMKSTPPHVRGAIQFNRLLKEHDLTNTWESMKEGEKGKFVYLKIPNNTNSDVLSFVVDIPEEFDVEKYIDMEKMFEKTILAPVEAILDPLKWSIEKKMTLDDFFQ